MTKERANKIMKELKENCGEHSNCTECVFYSIHLNNNTNCLLKQTNPIKYKIKSILDEKEKEYLSNIIKPFKNKVNYIKKAQSLNEDREYIEIAIRHDETLCFPWFKSGIMYNNMEINKKYTLEELEL